MTKQSKLIQLIERRKGVSLLSAAVKLGWQPHSVRGAISRLRKNGHPIKRILTNRGYRYVITRGAA